MTRTTTYAALLGLLTAVVAACGPPPKPASLIRLENLRARSNSKDIQKGDPGGWRESNSYFTMAQQAWQSSDMEEAEHYTTLATLHYRIAEARTTAAAAETTAKESARRIEVAREQQRFYQEDIARLRERVASLTKILTSAPKRPTVKAAKPKSIPPEKVAALEKAKAEAKAALEAADAVQASIHAPGEFNKARNLLTRANTEEEMGDYDKAIATLAEAKAALDEAGSAARPAHQKMQARIQRAETRKKLLAAAGSLRGVEVRDEPRGVVVVVPGLFPGRKIEILEKRYFLLDQVGKILMDFPTVPVIVEGHADESGPKGNREPRSMAYAEKVRDYFLAKGMKPERFRVEGYGDRMPIADGKSRKAKARNRRAEVVFLVR